MEQVQDNFQPVKVFERLSTLELLYCLTLFKEINEKEQSKRDQHFQDAIAAIINADYTPSNDLANFLLDSKVQEGLWAEEHLIELAKNSTFEKDEQLEGRLPDLLKKLGIEEQILPKLWAYAKATRN